MKRSQWEETLRTLESQYREISQRALLLPTFSLLPFGVGLWNLLKFYFAFFLDLILIIPINLVILLRNIFPGRWQFRSFSGKYWKYVFVWLWRGEAPSVPIGVVRHLVLLMIAVHVQYRYTILARHIRADSDLKPKDIEQLTRNANVIATHWKRPSWLQVTYTYILPALGPIIEIYKITFPGPFPKWANLLGIVLLGYAIGFIVTAFMVKRSLMLGATGSDAYFPGAVPGNKLYSAERDILSRVGISIREAPADIYLLFVNYAIGFIASSLWLDAFVSMNVHIDRTQFETQLIGQSVVFCALFAFCLYRRRASGRL